MFLFVECFAGSGLCDEVIIRSENHYCACTCVCVCRCVCVCVIVCDLTISTTRRHRPDLGCCVTK